MNGIFRKLHLWLSIPLGIVVSVTCFTGAMLVFEKEITALCNRDMISVEPSGAQLPLDSIVSCVETAMSGDVRVTGVTVLPGADEAYKVNISKPRRASVYVDQYTGEIKGKSERLPFFNDMLRLHRWLMDTRPADGGVYWGKMIVGTSTLLLVFVLITGFVIWWPRNAKMLKNRLRIVVGKGLNRFGYDLHVSGGFYVFAFLLIMAFTGLTWSFGWYRDVFYGFFDDGKNVTVKDAFAFTESEVSFVGCSASDAAVYPWQRAFDAVKEKYDDYEQITVSDGSITVRRGNFGNANASDTYSFNTVTGDIVSEKFYSDSPAKSKARGWVYSLHVGAWGGTVTRILAFIAALIGALLPITGYYFWIRKLYKKKKA